MVYEVKNQDTVLLEVIFDNNVLSRLCGKNKFESFFQDYQGLHSRELVRINFSITALTEQVLGANNQHFEKFRKTLDDFCLLCQKGLVLDPELHLRTLIEKKPTDEVSQQQQFWIGVMESMSSCKKYAAFDESFSPLKMYLENRLPELVFEKPYDNWKAFYEEIKDRPKLLKALLVKYKLSEHVLGWKNQEIIKYFSALDSVVDAYVFHFKKLMSGQKPKRSDYIDLDQLVYLDICDYLITNDGSLTHTTENCRNSELKGRLIRFEDFRNEMESGFTNLGKRAVRTHYLLI